jgi:Lrp/AsnC family leucine-responsive transcriptional regulator
MDSLDRRILELLERDSSISNIELAGLVHASPATCLRRVARLKESGVIVSTVALLDPAKVGSGLTAVIEVTLDRQDADSQDRFESAAVGDEAVRQCYRMSAGLDFILLAYVANMDDYHQFAHRLLGAHINVRNVRTLFSTRCAKFDTRRLPTSS